MDAEQTASKNINGLTVTVFGVWCAASPIIMSANSVSHYQDSSGFPNRVRQSMDVASGEFISVKQPTVKAIDSELIAIFNGLAKIWKSETGGLSSLSRRFQHPTYKAIIRLGSETVPLILQELKARPDWWFDALELLTKENPANPTDNFDQARTAWLKWGETHHQNG